MSNLYKNMFGYPQAILKANMKKLLMCNEYNLTINLKVQKNLLHFVNQMSSNFLLHFYMGYSNGQKIDFYLNSNEVDKIKEALVLL